MNVNNKYSLFIVFVKLKMTRLFLYWLMFAFAVLSIVLIVLASMFRFWMNPEPQPKTTDDTNTVSDTNEEHKTDSSTSDASPETTNDAPQ